MSFLSTIPVRFVVTVGFLACFFFAASPQAQERVEAIFQYSTINALLQGLYDGEMTIGELSRQGDMGLGTFNHLDGEMVAMDGAFYRVGMDGKARMVTAEEKTPFAVVTFFEAEEALPVSEGLSFKELIGFLVNSVSNRNAFQAYRLDGVFKSLRARSVPAQHKPYEKLAHVIEEQAVFEFVNVAGTLVGFRAPDYMAGLNVTGFHFHFLDADRSAGGHVLGLVTGPGTMRVNEIDEFHMKLPDTADFSHIELIGDHKEALEKVETRRD